MQGDRPNIHPEAEKPTTSDEVMIEISSRSGKKVLKMNNDFSGAFIINFNLRGISGIERREVIKR